ncbi:MAG: P-II family nitrogen regulator [Candidatus Bathyarchaeia archaeon]|nr:P-II family nitrogen regulator [Candidatus Bathyarchaeota archaeon]
MMKVEAIIRREKLLDVKTGLSEAGFAGLTVYEVRGRGRQRGYTLNFRGRPVNIDLLPKVKVEMIVDDSDVDKVIEVIRTYASTGEVGDGKIFLYPVIDAIRIRTGERGVEAT